MRSDLLNIVRFLGLALAFLLPGTAHAVIEIGGLTFDDNAFADRILSTDYTGLLGGCTGHEPADLDAALLGADLNTWIDYGPHDFFPGEEGDYDSTAPPTQYVELAFSDNLAMNETGPDIAIFQMGGANAVRVSLDIESILAPGAPESNEVVVVTSALPATADCGELVNVGYLELDDLGVPRGEGVYRICLSSPLGVDGIIMGPPTGYPGGAGGVPEIAAVGALNSGVKSNDAPLVDELEDAVVSQPDRPRGRGRSRRYWAPARSTRARTGMH